MTATSAPHEFAEGVAATLSAVRHLFRETDRLNAALVEGLLDEPDPFRFLGGTPLAPGKRTERLDRYVRDAYRLLLEPGASADEGEVADEEGEDDEGPVVSAADRAERLTRPRGTAEIDAAASYLAVGVVLRDEARPALPPHVHWAVLTGWGVGPEGRAPKDGRLSLAQYMVARILRAIDPAAPHDPERRVRTTARAKGSGRRMGEALVSFRLAAAPGMVPLVELETSEAVERLVARIKAGFRAAAARE